MGNPEYVKETALILRALQEAREHFYETSTEFELAPYGHVETRDSNPFNLAPYHELLREHLPNLANEVNAFGHRIGQLEAWSKVLPDCEALDQLTLAIELIDSIALSAVQTPYALRFRFIFAASHLSHQANKATDPSWGESRLPNDTGIDYRVMKRCVERWSTGPSLLNSLSGLSDSAYSEATGNFRNLYNHSAPPRLVHGFSGLVSRKRDSETGTTRYGFGARPPLELAHLASTLSVQHGHALTSFHALSRLVKEQLAAVYAI